MKRSISIIVLFALLAVVLTSCTWGEEEETIYGKLTRMTSQSEYSSITATVKTISSDGVELNSEFAYSNTADGTKVDYTVQSLNKFELVDGEYQIPNEMIKTSVGSVLISGDEIIEQKGDASVVSLSDFVMYPQLNFSEKIFKNADIGEGSFTATVISPAVFLGRPLSCSNMKVAVSYTDDAAQELTLTYSTAEGTLVSIVYKYEK